MTCCFKLVGRALLLLWGGRDFLGPVYGWFAEGLDTADLRAAKTLLEDLE